MTTPAQRQIMANVTAGMARDGMMQMPGTNRAQREAQRRAAELIAFQRAQLDIKSNRIIGEAK